MKTLVIGDLHGKKDIVEKCVSLNKPMIFVGDILDSFDRTPKEQIQSLEFILRLVENKRARLIRGNHEESYLRDSMRCSGYNFLTDSLFIPYRGMYNKLSEHFIWLPEARTLITHAGLNRSHWEDNNITVDNLTNKLEEAIIDKNSWFWHIGHFRGGLNTVGGPLWLDWDKEFDPIPEIRQIVGHSAFHHKTILARPGWGFIGTSTIRHSDNQDFNIDCLDTVDQIIELDMESGEIEVINL